MVIKCTNIHMVVLGYTVDLAYLGYTYHTHQNKGQSDIVIAIEQDFLSKSGISSL